MHKLNTIIWKTSILSMLAGSKDWSTVWLSEVNSSMRARIITNSNNSGEGGKVNSNVKKGRRTDQGTTINYTSIVYKKI